MEEQQMEFQELLNTLEGAWRGLPDKPGETPSGTLDQLWRLAGGAPEAGGPRPFLPEAALTRLCQLVRRRMAGEPLAYLLGHANFMNIDFLSGPEAMIPRVETEILAQAAWQLLQTMDDENIIIMDVCTGSGNVGLSLAVRETRCRLFGGDLSEQAIRLARLNASRLGLQDRATFLAGDFLEPFRGTALPGSVSLMTCNPPYISTASVERLPREISGFEPRAAFDGGPFGLSLLMRLIKEAHDFLRPGGWVACETGLGQGQVVEGMFKKSGNYRSVQTFPDPLGAIRAVAAQV